ncbi:anti-sigma factor antagonist [Streptomyces sp. me109]|nr:anti-sigma factor antagonist [Streptomyces sp. me109]
MRQALRVDGTGVSRTLLDLSEFALMDAGAINVLAAAQRDAVSADGWTGLASLRAAVQRVVEIVGLDTVVPCHPTLRQALTS